MEKELNEGCLACGKEAQEKLLCPICEDGLQENLQLISNVDLDEIQEE